MATQSDCDPHGYSINTTSAVTSLGRTKIYELIAAGTLEIVKVGNRTIVKSDSVRRLMGAM